MKRGELGLIAFRSPGVPLPFAEGDILRLKYSMEPWQVREALTIRSADGALLLCLTRGADLASLNPPPELAIDRGAEECPATSGCYFTSQYAYDVTFAGERRQVSFAAQTPLQATCS